MKNNNLPSEQESIENFKKWSNGFEAKYILGCDPCEENSEDLDGVFYLTGSEVIVRFEENLAKEEKEILEDNS